MTTSLMLGDDHFLDAGRLEEAEYDNSTAKVNISIARVCTM